MAYNDSGELQPNSTYQLGGYNFELKVQNTHEAGEEDVVSVFTICRGPDGSRETVPKDFPEGTTVENWRVEANDTTADVYATIGIPEKSDTLAPIDGIKYCSFIETSGIEEFTQYDGEHAGRIRIGENCRASINSSNNAVVACSSPFGIAMYRRDLPNGEWRGIFYGPSVAVTHNNKTAYYCTGHGGSELDQEMWRVLCSGGSYELDGIDQSMLAWYMIYGNTVPVYEYREELLGRFEIDLKEADGGPDGDWDEPGDDGPPGTTLYVTVTGATAGSCTGTPADNETVKGYGDGGDGGYGGGGGAGASTVIIYEFATDKAGSVNQEAIARGPGSGGPGGKGGKGGDGCILIFY